MPRYSPILLISILVLLGLNRPLHSQEDFTVDRIDPPFWWTGMEFNKIQLLVYGEDLYDAEVKLNSKSVILQKIHRPENKKYLFLDLQIKPTAKAGIYEISFTGKNQEEVVYPFELKERGSGDGKQQGFNSSDAVYLLMPDRFSNGDVSNDSIAGMLEYAIRDVPDARHGGDIRGILNHLDYISDMGFTALWINPLLENNMPEKSYHGYAITDLYNIDARFGSNSDYLELVNSAHEKGLKVIMDMVFNHIGTNHPLIRELPMPDWVNQWEEFTRSNFRGEVKVDPYASDYDKKLMGKGWFDATMADLNQENPFVLKYLIQNSIWWIEYAGIDAIRMDTYPYPDKNAMVEWAETIEKLYPSFTILGEIWLQRPAHTAYWQDNEINKDKYRSHVPVVTDFPLHYAVIEAMNEDEGWTQGLRRLYYILSQDMLYSNPNNLLIFPDNHDVNRFYTSLGEDFNKFKLAMAFLLTTRGIPQVYYGTEILMTGEEHKGHGYIRQDFPGGWEGDTVNAFNGEGLNNEQAEAQEFVKKLLQWRQKTPALQEGNLIHFIPENDVYVYFRYTDSQTIMVILNKKDNELILNTERYSEGLKDFSSAVDVLSGKRITDLCQIKVDGKSPMILELTKE